MLLCKGLLHIRSRATLVCTGHVYGFHAVWIHQTSQGRAQVTSAKHGFLHSQVLLDLATITVKHMLDTLRTTYPKYMRAPEESGCEQRTSHDVRVAAPTWICILQLRCNALLRAACEEDLWLRFPVANNLRTSVAEVSSRKQSAICSDRNLGYAQRLPCLASAVPSSMDADAATSQSAVLLFEPFRLRRPVHGEMRRALRRIRDRAAGGGQQMWEQVLGPEMAAATFWTNIFPTKIFPELSFWKSPYFGKLLLENNDQRLDQTWLRTGTPRE